MLKRKATTFIKNWLDTKDKKCLVVQGARQTGKTYIIERFAEENFEELLEINFKQMPSAMDIFAGDLTVDNMIMAMRFRFPEKKIVPGKTLIFLDEIQECQEAITSLKFWATDNRYDVITSGSLLGIDYKRASSYPVGYVDYLRMYGMDFEEFLWGIGISEEMIGNLCGYLHLKTVIPEAIHSQMMNYYRQYVATGGMPEVVQKYIDCLLYTSYTYVSGMDEEAQHTCENCGFTGKVKEFVNGCPCCDAASNIDYADKELGSKHHYDLVLQSPVYRIVTGVIDYIISFLLCSLWIINTSRTFNGYDVGKIFIYSTILAMILYRCV